MFRFAFVNRIRLDNLGRLAGQGHARFGAFGCYRFRRAHSFITDDGALTEYV